MILRHELVDIASTWGLQVTADQIERWHKRGILPGPEWQSDTKAWAYPDSAVCTLRLALTSKQSKRDLDALLIDVWMSGGVVQTDKLRALFIDFLLRLKGVVRNPFAAYSKFAKLMRKRGRPKQTPLPWAREDVLLSVVHLVIHVASPNGSVDILRPYRDDLDEEKRPEELLYHALGLDASPFVDVPTNDGAGLTDLNSILNADNLLNAVRQASDRDFESLNHLLATAEEWCSLVVTLRVVRPQMYRLLGLIEYALRRPALFRVYVGAVLLVMIHDEMSKSKVLATIAQWKENDLPRLRQLADYISYMRSHSPLGKRRDWNKFIQTCPPGVLQDLRNYHAAYCEAHPDFMSFLEQFQPT